MDTCIGRVSLNTAVELLAKHGDPVKQSTLSRYVTKYADALNPERSGRELMLDFELLLEHREQNINRAAAPAPTAAAAPSRVAHGRADMAALNIGAQWQLRELELAKLRGEVTPTHEVKEAAISAVAALKSAFALALNDAADVIGNVLGAEPRLVRPHLRAFEKKGLDAFVRVLGDHGLIQEETAAPP